MFYSIFFTDVSALLKETFLLAAGCTSYSFVYNVNFSIKMWFDNFLKKLMFWGSFFSSYQRYFLPWIVPLFLAGLTWLYVVAITLWSPMLRVCVCVCVGCGNYSFIPLYNSTSAENLYTIPKQFIMIDIFFSFWVHPPLGHHCRQKNNRSQQFINRNCCWRKPGTGIMNWGLPPWHDKRWWRCRFGFGFWYKTNSQRSHYSQTRREDKLKKFQF